MNENVGTSISVVPDDGAMVYAVDPGALKAAGVEMRSFFEARRAEMAALFAEQHAAYEHALAHTWASGALKRAAADTLKRGEFYDKIVKALEAGYLVIPNLPIDVFAIRKAREFPRGSMGFVKDAWQNGHGAHAQQPDDLPAGVGDTVSPLPVVEHGKDDEMVIVNHATGQKAAREFDTSRPTEFTAVEFPIALARPGIMNTTSRALALKVFDQVGVVNDRIGTRSAQKRADPIIVGVIRNPRKTRPDISFFIAWAASLERI